MGIKEKHINFPSPQFHIPSVTVLFSFLYSLESLIAKTARKLNQTIASSSSKIYFQKTGTLAKTMQK